MNETLPVSPIKIQLADDTVVWGGTPKRGSDGVDISNYHFLDVFTDFDCTEKLGMLGFGLSSGAESAWLFNRPYKDQDFDQVIVSAMSLALPSIVLPIINEDIKLVNSQFKVIKLVTMKTDLSLDRESGLIFLQGYDSPNEFILHYVYDEKITDEKIGLQILKRANKARLSLEVGDGRMVTHLLPMELFVGQDAIKRTVYDLIEDEYLKPLEADNLQGMPTFVRITKKGRIAIDKPVQDNLTSNQKRNNEYVNSTLITHLVNYNNKPFNMDKLVVLLNEFNFNYAKSNAYSSHALLRAILDHIPPIFSQNNFAQVASNYKWNKTDKSFMMKLESFRLEADDALHRMINKNDEVLSVDTLPSPRMLSVLLREAIQLLKSK